MPKPWEVTEKDIRDDVLRMRVRREEADRDDSYLFSVQLEDPDIPKDDTSPQTAESLDPSHGSALFTLKIAPWHGEAEIAYELARRLVQNAGMAPQGSALAAGTIAERGFEVETAEGVRWTFCRGQDDQQVEAWAVVDDELVSGELEIRFDDDAATVEAVPSLEAGVFVVPLDHLKRLAAFGGDLTLRRG